MAGRTIDLRQPSDILDVNVVNQLDLSTIEALLTQIRDSAAAIDANTDQVETKLDSVISELQTNGSTNHADLLNVITELQSIDANTDQLETQLASIIANTSTNATEATLSALLTAFNNEDFASETTLAAIKAITDQITFTGNDLNVNANLKSDLSKDYFSNLITVTPYDQVEVRFDKVDYADFINQTTINQGSITQSGGVVVVDAGSNVAGKACLESIDNIEYRPANEVYVSGTAVFSGGGVANNIRRVGMANDVNALDNSVTFGYEGTSFNIRYTSAGVEILNIAQSSWDDACDGLVGSEFTENGLPVALDPTKGNVYRIKAGLFGFAGWVAEIFSPDGKWVEVYRYRHNNNVDTPVFQSNSLKFIFFNENNGNTTPVAIKSQCWNGGANSQFDRIDSTLNERTLAQTVRSVITGQTSAGGGGFVNVKVNPSGSLEVNSNQDTHDNLNANANIQVGDVDVSNANPVPISADSLPLPTGASTEAKQDDQITALNNILGALGGTVEGEISEKDLLRQLIVLTKFQTEQQIKTNNLLKLILS